MPMDDRKSKVLQAIILDYIATADPVGSRTIARRYNLGVSPATVRNEMADLEEMGLIEQPHTSAGRIPSQSGYRYYVDFLMEKEPIRNEVREMISGVLLSRMRETELIIQTTSRLLSQLTNYTALVLAPSFGKNILRHVQFLPVGLNKAVMLIVLDNGHVEHRLIDMNDAMNEQEYQAISHILNEHLRGLTVEQWRPSTLQAIYHDLDQQKKMLRNVIEQIEDSLTVDREKKVYLGGALNILNQPEFRDVDKVKTLLELLEEENIMKEVLNPMDENGIMVKIGKENLHEGMKDCSLITATYRVDGKVIGTLGVLGPTRMEYSKAVSIVEILTSALTEGLKKL